VVSGGRGGTGVLCRSGMLMLTADNTTILGGEVESLVASHTPLNVINDSL